MIAVLYALGIMIGTAGLMAIGFAVAIREFSLGNALIMAGTTAVVGGLTLIGLGAVVRELARLRSALEKAAQFMRPAESLPPRVATARVPAPPRPLPAGAPRAPRMEPPVESPAPRAVEPARQDARQDAHHAPRAPGRPGLFASIRGVRSEAQTADARDAATAPESPPREEPRFEPKFGSALPAEGAPPSPATLATRTAARFEAPRPMPEPPSTPERSARNLFDTVWPNDHKAAPEPAPAVPAIGAPPQPPDHEDFQRSTNEEPSPRHSEPLPPPMPEERPGILKSGVIDGMAYTLYVDGSIEAQLPQGLIRFASIDELRAHLENHNA